MLYPTLEFALFFIFIFALYWLLKKRFRTKTLLIINYFFYGFFDVRFLVLLFFYTCVVYLLGQKMAQAHKSHQKYYLYVGVFISLSQLGIFKYLDFFRELTDHLLTFLGVSWPMPAVEFIFPVGVSFFTFQALTYLFAIADGQRSQAATFINLATFISFFPSISAGPICRAKDLLTQIEQGGQDSPIKPYQAMSLLFIGAFKKVVVSSYLSTQWVQPVFNDPSHFSASTIICAVYAYTMQIYCDFSGYSDMTIAVAQLLGFGLKNNFESPYLATNLKIFWRRWHISLSSFIRDYLYIRLGGSQQKTLFRTSLNLIFCMLASGLWHGAHVRYLIWGGLHGLGVVILSFYQKLNIYPRIQSYTWLQRSYLLIAWLLTFNYVACLWIFFRADSLAQALSVIEGITHTHWTMDLSFYKFMAGLLLGFVALFLGPKIKDKLTQSIEYCPVLIKPVLVTVYVYIIITLGPQGIPPFIYFQY